MQAGIDNMLNTWLQDIVEETIQLPVASRLSSGLLQQVSRVAEAYIENVDSSGKVRSSKTLISCMQTVNVFMDRSG